MDQGSSNAVPARFNLGDRVRVKDLPNIFYSRTQLYVRGVIGTVVARTNQSPIPEDEAWNREDVQPEQFYIVRFCQKDLWEEYPFENDTLQTEFSDRWLDPA
jgi:thiocyanate hydrolase subunit beta